MDDTDRYNCAAKARGFPSQWPLPAQGRRRGMRTRTPQTKQATDTVGFTLSRTPVARSEFTQLAYVPANGIVFKLCVSVCL